MAFILNISAGVVGGLGPWEPVALHLRLPERRLPYSLMWLCLLLLLFLLDSMHAMLRFLKVLERKSSPHFLILDFLFIAVFIIIGGGFGLRSVSHVCLLLLRLHYVAFALELRHLDVSF